MVVKPVVEKKINQLPAGPLYWRLENFPTLAKARAKSTDDAASVRSRDFMCSGYSPFEKCRHIRYLIVIRPQNEPARAGGRWARAG
ncbi:MAG TPA: hypothetical protein VE131_09215 [Terriglobales bacterium]|nr:hypothetical protein [Terriglobales bacterium]